MPASVGDERVKSIVCSLCAGREREVKYICKIKVISLSSVMQRRLSLLHCGRVLRGSKSLTSTRSLAAFSGGHHHDAYDWRDDPKVNKDIEEDIRDRGWDVKSYTFPYSKKHDDWIFDVTMPSGNYQTDLTVNIHPENKPIQEMKQIMRVTNPSPVLTHSFPFPSSRSNPTGILNTILSTSSTTSQKTWTSSASPSSHR